MAHEQGRSVAILHVSWLGRGHLRVHSASMGSRFRGQGLETNVGCPNWVKTGRTRPSHVWSGFGPESGPINRAGNELPTL
jgi:hypothetical protein